MKRIIPALGAVVMLALVATGCMNFKLIAVDRKTQLENQILGSFGELQKDLVLMQSVRGEGQDSAALPPAQREALQAMMNRQFNADDIAVLKAQGVAAETRSGLLVLRDTPRTERDADFKAEAKRLLDEENRDRQVFMKRVIAINPKLSEKDLPHVQSMLFRLNADGSAPGTLIEDDHGAFVAKPEPAGA